MVIKYSLIDLFLLIGVVQGFFLSIVLIAIKKGNSHANRYLALFILSFSLLTLGDFLDNTHLLLSYPHFLLVFDPLIFILAPFFYFYVQSMTNRDWKLQDKDIIHFIPVILTYFLFSIVYFMSWQDKINLIMDSYNNPDHSGDIFLVIAAIQILVYFAFALRMLRLYTVRIKNYFSYQESINLKWLKILSLINCFLWIAFTGSTLYHIKLFIDISNLLFPFAVYLIGYFGFKQPEIFFYGKDDIAKNNTTQVQTIKYAGSNLSEEMANEYLIKLLKIMEAEKLFLKNDLKLFDVANRISIPMHHLSQVINEKLSKNFNDFVNEYRIEEFKRRLFCKEYTHLTILAIALDSGFNSKATLNSIFKKNTGFSPGEYKKKFASS